MKTEWTKMVKKLQSKTRIAKMRKAYGDGSKYDCGDAFDKLLEDVLNPWSDANFEGYTAKRCSDGSRSVNAIFASCHANAVYVGGECTYFWYDATDYDDGRGYGFKVDDDGKKHYFNSSYAFDLDDGTEIERMYDYIFVQRRMRECNWIIDHVSLF